MLRYKHPFMMATMLSLVFMLAACHGSEQQSAEQPTQAITEQQGAELIDTNGIVTYRPDTACVYYTDTIDADKTFIVISKKNLQLSVYADLGNGDTTLVARYPVCLSRKKGQKEGSGDMKTPESEPGEPFHIKQIQDASDWKHDFGDGRGEILSYGHWFMRLETPFNGIGIHGSTNNEDKMPGRDSEGCIRLRDSDLDHLHDNYAHVGMPVIIKAEGQGDLPFETKAQKSEGQRLR